MKVMEDFESRPHKAVSFMAEKDREIQEWREQQMPKALSGFSGGKLPGRSKAEKGSEEEDEDEDSQERQMKSKVTEEVVAGMMKARNTGFENGVKIVGQEFSRGSESTICSESKACRLVRQSRKK